MVFGKGNGNWLPKAEGKTLEPSRAWSRKRVLRAAADAMVRLGEAGIAALRAFFGTKRGTRQLIESPPSSRGITVVGSARARAGRRDGH